MKKVYFDTTNENLPIFGVPAAKLKDYSTSKKDMKRGAEIIPEETYRLIKEDIFTPKKDFQAPQARDSFTSSGSTSASSSASFGMKGAGASAGATTSPSAGGSFPGGGDQFGEDYDPKHGFRDASRTLYAKKGDNKVTLQDFVIRKVIGRGSFGKVFLVEKKDTKEVYAMKSLRKDVILDYDQVESTKLEKEILMQADHPFLVGMHYVFQTEPKIFFVMRFVRGGELFMHLRNATRFPEERAKFYAVQVALAIGHLHKKHIIYRDLKPENILMDEDGYICLTDFGLAKILTDNA